MSATPLPNEIRDLPVSDRVRLAEQIWDSVIEDESDFLLTASQQAELRKRLQSHRNDPSRGRAWSDVTSGLLGE